MENLSDFRQDSTHSLIAVEQIWRDFVRFIGGTVIEDFLPQPRQFQNADFSFLENSIFAELKEIETEFSKAPAFFREYEALLSKLISENPEWRPALFGGQNHYPSWFNTEFIRLFRPPLLRILKKANRQLRETKSHFGINSPTGILLLVNDGFTTIGPDLIRALISDILLHTYSSIDCFIYLTVNRYIKIEGYEEPMLVWVPTYSCRASDALVHFVDDLGRKWHDFLETNTGPFTSKSEVPQESNILKNSQSIVIKITNQYSK